LFYGSAKVFARKKHNCLTIIQKQKIFILELSLNNSKFFRIKFCRSVKQRFNCKTRSIVAINFLTKDEHKDQYNTFLTSTRTCEISHGRGNRTRKLKRQSPKP